MITVPIAYPGDDEFIAVVTRMRLAGAWDPQNDTFIYHGVKPGVPGYYDFIRRCVGFARRHEATWQHDWVIALALTDRDFVSYNEPPWYIIAKAVPV